MGISEKKKYEWPNDICKMCSSSLVRKIKK